MKINSSFAYAKLEKSIENNLLNIYKNHENT